MLGLKILMFGLKISACFDLYNYDCSNRELSEN